MSPACQVIKDPFILLKAFQQKKSPFFKENQDKKTASADVIKVLLILLKNTSFCKAFREKSLFFKEKSYPTKELPLQVQLGTAVLLVSLLFELEFNYVNSAKLLAVLRILLCVESNLLALFKSLEAVAYDCGKVYEYVVAAIIVGDESVAFLRIEPLNCTVVHFGTSIKN